MKSKLILVSILLTVLWLNLTITPNLCKYDKAFAETQNGQKTNLKLTSNPDNYINYVTANGKIMRWNLNRMPLKVYIDTSNPWYNVENPIKDAFDTWMNALDGKVSYVLINDPDSADIKVLFKNYDYINKNAG